MKRILFILLLTIPFVGFGQINDIGYGSTGNSVYKTTNGGVTWNYLTGDDLVTISFPISNNTTIIETNTSISKRELVKTTNILGQENTTIKNQPLIEIYDDGSTEKKMVIE